MPNLQSRRVTLLEFLVVFFRELLDHIKEFVVKVLEGYEKFFLGWHSRDGLHRIFSVDMVLPGVFIVYVV